MLSLDDVVAYIGKSTESKPFTAGKETLDANYLKNVRIRNEEAGSVLLEAECIQESKPRENPHALSVVTSTAIDGSVNITGHCSCAAGSFARCKHIGALMLFLTETKKENIPTKSCTDIECQWNKETKKYQEEISRPIPLKNFCHHPSKKNEMPCIPQFMNSPEYGLILKGCEKNNPYFRHVDDVELNTAFHQEVVEHMLAVSLQDHSLLSDDLSCTCLSFIDEYVRVTPEQARNIYFDTLGQNSSTWKRHRKVRITGSIAYTLYTYYWGRGAGAENWDEKLTRLLFSSFQGNEYTLYGKQYEDKCLQLYENDISSVVLKNCGILINPNTYWFAYSPDGFVRTDNEIVLLEVKCLQIGKEYAGNSFCKKVPFLKMGTNGEFKMIKNHAYYCQIQLGLFVCSLQRAKLLLFVQKEPSVVAIDVPRDEDFLVHFVNTLTNVYREYFLLFLCKNENKIK